MNFIECLICPEKTITFAQKAECIQMAACCEYIYIYVYACTYLHVFEMSMFCDYFLASMLQNEICISTKSYLNLLRPVLLFWPLIDS